MIDFDKLTPAMALPLEKSPEPASPFHNDSSEYMPTDEEGNFRTDENSTVIKLPVIVDSATFIGEVLPEPASLIKGLVHQGTKVIVGGGSKSFKTWIQLDCAVCVAYGLPWLGFETTPGRVLFVNFEIQPVFFQGRLKTISEARGLTLEPGRLDVWNLRGFSAPYAILIPQIIERIKEVGYSLVILDPIYKLYGSANENDASEVAQLLNSLERVCVDTDAAVMFGAHYSKGNQSSKESIDRISGSGVFARDPDSIIPFTMHENEGSFVVEPTLRNLPPVEAFTVTWNYPFMERDDSLDPTKLKQQAKAGRTREHDPLELLSFIRETTPENPISVTEWAERANLKRQTLSGYMEGLRNSGLITTVGEGKWARKCITSKGLSVL